MVEKERGRRERTVGGREGERKEGEDSRGREGERKEGEDSRR